jgi:hypothetical protein
MMLAAAGLAISPVASNAASSLSIARAAPQMTGPSYLQGDDNHGGGRTAMVTLGGLLLVLIIIVAIAGTSANHASNSP